jgi:hypothetical protein
MRTSEILSVAEERASFSTCLAPVRPFLGHSLISPDAWESILAAASLLPAALARSAFGFECRLQSDAADADFWIIVGAGSGAREVLASFLSEQAGGQAQHEYWKSLQRFAAAWSEPSSRLYKGISMAYLEFDLAGQSTQPALPNVWISPCKDAFSHEGSPGRRPSLTAAEYREILDAAQWELRGTDLTPDLVDALDRLLSALPDGVPVTYVGFMLARGDRALRFRISQPSPGQIIEMLERLCWPGPITEIRDLLAALLPLAPLRSLLIDLEPGIRPHIGIECHAGFGDPLHMHNAWCDLLEWVKLRGWCLPAKQKALSEWLGLSAVDATRTDCPPFLRRHLEAHPELIGIMERSLSVLKLTWRGAGQMEAKAYPAVRYAFGLRSALATRL